LIPTKRFIPELHGGGLELGKMEQSGISLEADAINDVKKRREWYHKANSILAEYAPYALIAHVNERKVFGKHVKNFDAIPAELVNLGNVWIDTG
jgi:ABC-type transport system substrate-binding protein